jgi:tetratricopeptide (TPR) repeat protein
MRTAFLVFLAMCAAPFPAAAELMAADELLRRLDAEAAETKTLSPAAALQEDLRRFQAAGAMEPKQAATSWLSLYERARPLGQIPSVMASLPGPAAWPFLREGAAARAAESPEDARALALQMLAELLEGNRQAALATLSRFERLAEGRPAAEREKMLSDAAAMRAELARLYGTPEEIAASFVASLDRHEGREASLPDLVGLVGAEKAEAILRGVLARKVAFYVPEGGDTRSLARRLALEQVASLRQPQWGLVDGPQAAALYEVLTKHFPDLKGDAPRRREADTYYFLHLVIQGRRAEAEKVLVALARTEALSLPAQATQALERPGHHESLFRFLHGVLKRRPELRAWDVYAREAAYTGQSAELIELTDDLVSRTDLPAQVRAAMRVHRMDAMLAADKVEAALAGARGLLAIRPMQGEGTARVEAAIRLVGLGRVLGRQPLAELGLSFAGEALALPVESDEHARERRLLVRRLLAEERKLGLLEQAQARALAELQRTPGDKAMLVELAALYAQAKRHGDVLALLNNLHRWSVRETLTETDSLGVPLGEIAAQAHANAGDPATALDLARALVEAMPDHHPAYELIARLDKEADRYFERLQASDRFEARPLVWRAILLRRAGRSLEAESLVRSAIAVDASDLRAHAVLAELLEARGQKSQAASFRNALAASRLSEQADELQRLGLYERAFAGYRKALGRFADGYCIQSRLALRLHQQGRRNEAFEHYRRAYERMPSGIGRVERPCSGAERLFAGPEQQRIAERVFGGLLKKEPENPRAHYLLGRLHHERGLLVEALRSWRTAVELDPDYLDAWQKLHDLGARLYVDARERDVVRLKLLELDPRRRHTCYALADVADLAALWRAAEAAASRQPVPGPRQVLAGHTLVRASLTLLGVGATGLSR